MVKNATNARGVSWGLSSLFVVLTWVVGCGNSPVVGGNDATPKDIAEASVDAPLMCATGQTACAGRCVDTTSDSSNCGACGNACMSGLTCVMGSCQLRCADGQTLCAGRCVSLQTDGTNCGACGTTCSAGQVCAAGRCDVSCGGMLSTCGGATDDAGVSDAGGGDGGAGGKRYCADTRIDPRNCGGCGMTCDLANASISACAAGMCVVGGCNAGFADCDANPTNGCETATRGTDANNCGGCGIVCRIANAAATCAMGACTMGSCNAGFADCDMNAANGCETSTTSDNANCGMCGRACSAGQVCSMGTCGASCGAGATNCSGDCVNTQTDPSNCGMCGTACRLANASVNACVAGGCVVGGCSAGFADCDGVAANGCETTTRGTDVNNCGGCGVVCRFANAAVTCAMGACTMGACSAGFADCDMNAANGCETSTTTDNANCGMCGRACTAGQVCSMGTCGASCGAGVTNCSGDCVNTQTDPSNCGMCGTACRLANVSVNACVAGGCVVGGCNAGFADCDANPTNGCETATRGSDVNNCGGCGVVCRFANAAATCSTGTCTMGACSAGFADCDMNAANGCETNTNTDNTSCGMCGRACTAGQVCATGACGASCGAGTTNCSGDCVNTTTDPSNCGMCARACRLANASVNACVAGGCVVGGCNAGFADCDANPTNGCETATRGSDANNCGGCGIVCRFANAAATCSTGTCVLGACATGFANCDSNAANGCETSTTTDNANCGMCGRACTAGQTCASGTCGVSCGAGTTNCSGACVNTSTDPSNCGMCGTTCRLANVSVNACVASACVVGGCSAGFADCDGTAANGCETNVRGADGSNCGGCGVVCRFTNAGATCTSGTCALGACNPGFANCDSNAANGCETSTNTDNANCGGCGRACAAGQVCASGTCTTSCGTGTTNCSGACVNTNTDPSNCGACARACALANVSVNACVAGGCVVGGCATGFGDCDGTASNGCERNLRGTDANNCGGCGVVCRFANAAATCSTGTCVLGACATGFADCDMNAANGCETSTTTDNANCGMCGRACTAGQVCSMGTCTTSCGTGTTNCSGVCVNTATDPAHCNGCGMACNLANVSVNACVSSRCVVGACATGFADCNATASDGCEAGLNTSTAHCGRCGNACAAGQSCVSGTCTTVTLGGTTYQIPGLGTDGCNVVDHNGVTSDDRGGIALSSSQVFYTGDSATGRFALTNLSGGASVGAMYDALFSDLATQQAYAFGTAAGPMLASFSGANVTLDRFFALNATTGAAGAATMLSAPIVVSDTIFGAGTGYFSGLGRVVVVSNGRVYDVSLPSGTVVDRGAFTFPAHSTCENHAVWGVAEFFGGALYIAYVQSSTAIVRTQVAPAGGTTSTIATFSSLSDMCSFVASPQNDRWYFHHEGGSQFGGSAETVGYCNMTRRNCREVLASGGATSGVYTIDPDGAGSVAPFSVYCDQTNDGGGWTLLGRLGDPRYLPNLDRNLGSITAPGGTGNLLITQHASITGTAVRVGRMVGTGTNTGNFYQINDCSSGDAACWYGRYISQNDGDTFGAWLTAGGNWGFVPGGCGDDQCPTTGGDRDHSAAQRIAIFGGDCHSSCNNGVDDVRNGLVYRDYGDPTSPARIGNRGWWGAGTVTPGATALGQTNEIADYGQGGTLWRDLWIR